MLKIFIRITLLCTACLFSNNVFAALNVLGIYSGTFNSINSGCIVPGDNGPGSSAETFTISSQNGNSFSGIDAQGGTFAGTVDDAGNVSGAYQSAPTFAVSGPFHDADAGIFSGTITSTNWTLSWTSTVPGSSSGCFTDSTATLIRNNGVNSALVEQSRQIVRTTNTLVSQHLASSVVNAFMFKPALDKEIKQGAGSDQINNTPISFWGTTSLTEIHEDGAELVNFDTDIYQFVGGIDKKIGDVFVGTALTYAYSETEQLFADSTTQVLGITPYAAYQLTDFMFVSGLAGYNYSYIKHDIIDLDTDVHDYIIEGNLNFFKTFWQSIILKTRVGARFHHTYISSTNKPLDATTDELLWLGDIELGYAFNNGLISYVGLNYEYFDREESFQNIKEHDGIAYFRGGFDYPVTNNLTLGAKVQADLNDEDTDVITGSMTARVNF